MGAPVAIKRPFSSKSSSEMAMIAPSHQSSSKSIGTVLSLKLARLRPQITNDALLQHTSAQGFFP